MTYNVKFLKGTAAQYEALTTKDINTFYYVDSDLYLGTIKLSSDADLAAAIVRIAANETNIGTVGSLTTTAKSNLVAAINEIKAEVTALVGNETGGINDMIEAITGKLADLATTDKTNLVAAINEIVDNVAASAVTVEVGTTSTGAAKTYVVKQGTKTVGTIDIPKDMVVSEGRVVTNPEGQPAGTYIELTLANNDGTKLYINVGTLVDIYTAEASATQVQLAINSSTREISATIVAKSIGTAELADNAVTTVKIGDKQVTNDKIADTTITKAKLAKEVTDDLALGASAVQEVKEGTANGTILVDGTAVDVHGLKSAAYAETTAFDAAGAATDALNDAKTYIDTKLSNALTWGTIV